MASERRLCAVGREIARGVAEHVTERVQISETTCMHKGAEKCTILVQQVQ